MRRIQYIMLIAASFFLISAPILASSGSASTARPGFLIRGFSGPAFSTPGSSARSYMPPNEASIISAFKARATVEKGLGVREEGLLSKGVDVQRIYTDYIKRKLGKRPEDRPHPMGAKCIAKGEESDKIHNHHGQKMANGQRLDHILILLVEFAGTDADADTGTDGPHTGPLHNEIPEPEIKCNSRNFWIFDFNREHYEKMLFDKTEGALSMSNYYLEQSGDTYTVDGRAYGWIKVKHSEWYYGADDTEEGIDNLNGLVWHLVKDAIDAAGDSIPWADFDKEDPYDLDEDGIYDEPDGYVDHIMIIHAGAGQESSGGHQGDDAIWSHSGWADWHFERGPGIGGIPTSNPKVWVGAYTMEPEDGTIGVFCHEFAHDLGLPDEYDTIFSGDASTGYWTLMSSGGWLNLPGSAAGTCPANLSIWGKYVLGWADPVTINPGEKKECLLLRPVEERGMTDKCVKINLPDSTSTTEINEPHSGEYEWYSSKGNNLRTTLTRVFDLPPGPGTLLKFWTWYDIEDGYDYGCVEICSDAARPGGPSGIGNSSSAARTCGAARTSGSGQRWQKIPGNITTTDDPYGQNPGNGITGKSNGWVQAEFDLSPYLSQGQGKISIRFKYLTDFDVQGLGWAIDDLEIISGSGNQVFSDTVESGAGNWAAKGWDIFTGSEETRVLRYYLTEWRQPVGFDASMTNWYHVVDSVPPNNQVETFPAGPGMLLWYRDGEFSDNWIGIHPWKGFLLIVDSHPELFLADDTAWLANWLFEPQAPYYDPSYPNMNLPFCTRLQITDAAFGLKLTTKSSLTRWFGLPVSSQIPELPPVSVFDDSISYVDKSWAAWFESWPFGIYICNSINSVDTGTYGLKVTVEKENAFEGARISVDFTNTSRWK